MEITKSSAAGKQRFVTDINMLLGDIKKAVHGHTIKNADTRTDLQIRLDILADLFQDDEEMGKLSYRLYYAQALLYYYEDKPGQSMQFLESAEQVYGGGFEAGDELRARLESSGADLTHSPAKAGSAAMPASSNRRFFNNLIDITVCYMLTVPLLIALSSSSTNVFFNADTGESTGLAYVFVLGIFFLYYLCMELIFDRTLGKLVTRTKVVSADGSHPSGLQVFKRSLARFIPFDNFSYFGKNPVGWHDKLSGTRVVRNK